MSRVAVHLRTQVNLRNSRHWSHVASGVATRKECEYRLTPVLVSRF